VGPQAIFGASLFLDIWIMSMDFRLRFMDDWSSWEKIDEILFFIKVIDHSVSDQSLFLDWLSKIEKSNIIVS